MLFLYITETLTRWSKSENADIWNKEEYITFHRLFCAMKNMTLISRDTPRSLRASIARRSDFKNNATDPVFRSGFPRRRRAVIQVVTIIMTSIFLLCNRIWHMRRGSDTHRTYLRPGTRVDACTSRILIVSGRGPRRLPGSIRLPAFYFSWRFCHDRGGNLLKILLA